MRLRYLLAVAAVLCFGALASPTHAAMGFSATLSGAAENPDVVTPATGFAILMLNDAETEVSYHIEFSGLLAAETAAHFHGPQCDPSLNAGVVFPLPLGSPKVGVWPIEPDEVTALKNGCIYVNIHSTLVPGGEIRGNLQRDDSVPTATTTWGRLKVTYR
jgi:hypothetical protein